MTVNRLVASRPHLWAFLAGCLAVTSGVVLHLPMFWMGRDNGFQLAQMPMDNGMMVGMLLIVAGIAAAGYGLLPARSPAGARSDAAGIITAPDDAPLSWKHVQLMAVLTVALVIDVMKPASLGFVLPGMMREYGIARETVAWLPFAALCGTVVGSVAWGMLADLFGRRASILLSAVMFVGTAICGAMPSLWWNVGMCFLMGAAAGGMLPVTYALLAETIPTRHRGWALVLVGGLGAVGGYVAASASAAWLEPILSWRVLWLLNLPTGLILIALNVFIPESAKFLLSVGRVEEARAALGRFGSVLTTAATPTEPHARNEASSSHLLGKTSALSVTAVAWGLINFGLLLWLPANMVAKGYSMSLSSQLLAASALLALPTVFVAAFLYGRWSSKGALLGAIAVTALGLAALLHLEVVSPATGSPVIPVALLIVGVNGIIAMVLPYAAEIYPIHIRGLATGWIAACTKAGGLIAQLLSLLGMVPTFGITTMAILAAVLLSLVLAWRFCVETQGRRPGTLPGLSTPR
jgi:putative MFS transporter